MAVTLIVGGQFGDEGKGKIISYLALNDKPKIIARGGVGPNAGHQVKYGGKVYSLRLTPSGFINKDARLLIGAGVAINPEVIIKEIEDLKEFGIKERLGIDRRCTVITQKEIEEDRNAAISNKVGSTKSGCGPAVSKRASRIAKLAKDEEKLQGYLTDVYKELAECNNILIEGSQGFMLSNLYGTYPYVTSKDVSASTICADVGIGPKRIDEVIMVVKSYTTRVGTGPFKGEVGRDEAEKAGFQEYGTVTGRPRRTSMELHWEDLKMAASINSATCIALTKIDVKFPNAEGVKEYEELPEEAKEFVKNVEEKLGVKVGLISTGAEAEALIDLRKRD